MSYRSKGGGGLLRDVEYGGPGGGGGARAPPPKKKKSCIYNCLCFNLLFRACVNFFDNYRPHINHPYALKSALKYAYLILFMHTYVSYAMYISLQPYVDE